MSNPCGGSSTLHILTDARSACIRRAAEYYRDNRCKFGTIEPQWARHKNVGSKLLQLAKTCDGGATILITVPRIDDGELKNAQSALKKLNRKNCIVRWYHGPDWFDKSRSVPNIFEDNSYGDDLTCNLNRYYEQEENEFENRARGEKSAIDRLRDYIEYRLMYLFLEIDREENSLKCIIEAIAANKEKSFAAPGEGSVKSDTMAKLVERYAEYGYPSLAGRSSAIEGIKKKVAQLAAADTNVLIQGETGTGKEAIAYFLHELSPRRDKSYVTINCACFTDELLESELFGHVKGAFTGASQEKKGKVEEAENGTIFLDELPDASPRVQAKLLRFLQSGEFTPVGATNSKRVDVKIVAGAQPKMLGNLRDDFLFRIASNTVKTHPLRELNEMKNDQGKEPDIVTIARNLLSRLRGKYKIDASSRGFEPNRTIVTHKDIVELWDELDKPETATLLTSYHWPGNVRQLFTVMERRVCLGAAIGKSIGEWQQELTALQPSGQSPDAGAAALASSPAPSKPSGIVSFNPISSPDEVENLYSLERRYLEHVNDSLPGQQQKVILERLGIQRNTFRNILDGKKKGKKTPKETGLKAAGEAPGKRSL